MSAARRSKSLCATPVVPRSTPATNRSVTLTTCSSQLAPCFSDPSVLGVSLLGPPGMPSDAQPGWHRGQSANPYLLHCCTAEPVLTRATNFVQKSTKSQETIFFKKDVILKNPLKEKFKKKKQQKKSKRKRLFSNTIINNEEKGNEEQKKELQGATAARVRRHDPSHCVRACIVCAVCVCSDIRPTCQRDKGSAPREATRSWQSAVARRSGAHRSGCL